MAISTNVSIRGLVPGLAVLTVLFAGEAWYLLHVNRGLSAEVQMLKGDDARNAELKHGDRVLGATGFGMDGQRISVQMAEGTRTLLITISSGCPGCIGSVDGFRRLAVQAGTRGLQVVFVSRDYLPEMQASEMSHLPGTILSEPTYRTFNSAKLLTVPQVAIISGTGVVEAAMSGQLDAAKEAQIVSWFRSQ